MRRILLPVLLLGLAAAMIRPAAASQLLFSGDLVASDPRFNRPEGGEEPPFVLSLTGTAVPYDVVPWYSTSTFDVTIFVGRSGIGEQPRVFIYQDSFDPANPLQNAIYQFSGTTLTPDPYRQYFVVVCGDSNNSQVAYEGQLSQASSNQLFFGNVPEPSTAAFALAAGAGLLAWRWGRRDKADGAPPMIPPGP